VPHSNHGELISLDLLIDSQYSSDILSASKVLSCPQLPFISLQGEMNPTLQDQLGFGPTDLEDGFMRLCKIGFNAELAEVYQAMKAYISTVEKYLDGTAAEPDMCRISNQRNLVQYHLLSLPSVAKLNPKFRQSYPVYEACRLAGLIFGVGVIFPLPIRTAPFQTLVKLLQAELWESKLESTWCSRDAVGVLLWILTLGGIAARGLPERAWFVATLGWATAHCDLSRWRDLKQILEMMPWLDSACDNAGQQLWDELQTSGSRTLFEKRHCGADI
jgi:hypothetical protein